MISVLFFFIEMGNRCSSLFFGSSFSAEWESGFLAWIADLQNTMEGDNVKPDSIKAKIKEELFKR